MDENRRAAEREERLQARRRDNRWKTLILCVVIGAAIVIGIVVMVQTKTPGLKDENGKLTLNTDHGFPYSVGNTGAASRALKATNDQLVLLNGTLLEFVNPSNGKGVKSVTHFYANPVLDVNGKYALTFDQGHAKLRVDTGANNLFENELEQNIITAAIGADGTFAVATVPEQGDSDLTVYSKSLKELFTWNSMNGYIIEIELSPDGNFIAVATTDSVEADLKTTVHIFNLAKKNEVYTFDLTGSAAPVLQYVSGNDLFVLSPDGCYYISNHKECEELLKPGEQALLDYAFSSDGTLSLLYSKYDNSSSTEMTAFTKGGKVLFTKELTETVKDIYATRSVTGVLYSNRTETLNRKGELQGSTEISPYANSLVQFGSRLYVLGADAIESVQVKPA